MIARLRLLWYQGRLGLSWAGLAPPLTLAGAVLALSLLAPLGERGHDLGVALEVGLPLLAGLLAVPLVLAEQERHTLDLLAVRVPLPQLLLARLAVLAGALLACGGLAVLAAWVLWGGPELGAALPRAMAPALTFATLGLLAAHAGRSPVHGYLLIVAVWIGVLVSVTLLPRSDPWLTLNPFGWTYGFGPELVARSKVLFVVAGLVLLLPQGLLLRPERLSRQG